MYVEISGKAGNIIFYPLRFISESLNLNVGRDEVSRTITIQ